MKTNQVDRFAVRLSHYPQKNQKFGPLESTHLRSIGIKDARVEFTVSKEFGHWLIIRTQTMGVPMFTALGNPVTDIIWLLEGEGLMYNRLDAFLE